MPRKSSIGCKDRLVRGIIFMPGKNLLGILHGVKSLPDARGQRASVSQNENLLDFEFILSELCFRDTVRNVITGGSGALTSGLIFFLKVV
jgi:hypothetical protein